MSSPRVDFAAIRPEDPTIEARQESGRDLRQLAGKCGDMSCEIAVSVPAHRSGELEYSPPER